MKKLLEFWKSSPRRSAARDILLPPCDPLSYTLGDLEMGEIVLPARQSKRFQWTKRSPTSFRVLKMIVEGTAPKDSVICEGIRVGGMEVMFGSCTFSEIASYDGFCEMPTLIAGMEIEVRCYWTSSLLDGDRSFKLRFYGTRGTIVAP